MYEKFLAGFASPPAEHAEGREHQAGKPRADDRAGDADRAVAYAFAECERVARDCQEEGEMLRRSSAAVATSRGGHRSPRSSPAGQHRRWGWVCSFR
jgi:hypothetical protein